MGERVRHRPMPKGADEPPSAVHREVARGPRRREADVAGEYGVRGSLLADRLRDLLGVDQPLSGRADGEIVEGFARPLIMALRVGEMRAVSFLTQQRQQRNERRADVTHDPEIDDGTATDVFRPEVDL